NVSRAVPTASLRSGKLTFNDCSSGVFDSQGNCTGGGDPLQYNLKSAANCGADANGQPLNLPCDPRAIGISPTIQQLWDLMPSGNDTTLGDQGQNIIGFRGTAPSPLKDDFVTVRLDHKFNDKVQFFGRYAYDRDVQPNGFQVDLRSGSAVTPSNSSLRGDTQ